MLNTKYIYRTIALALFLLLGAQWIIASPRPVYAQFTTPVTDGVITSNEYGDHTNGQNRGLSATGQNWYMTWDDTNLYVAITNANLSEGAVIYIDKDPTGGQGIRYGNNGTRNGWNYDSTTYTALPFRADFVTYFGDGYRDYHRFDVNSQAWLSAVTGFGSYASNTTTRTRELTIPWSAITGSTRPAKFSWFGFLVSSGGVADSKMPPTPVSNAGLDTQPIYYYSIEVPYANDFRATNTETAIKPFAQRSLNVRISGAYTPEKLFRMTVDNSVSVNTASAGTWDITTELYIGDMNNFNVTPPGSKLNVDMLLIYDGTATLADTPLRANIIDIGYDYGRLYTAGNIEASTISNSGFVTISGSPTILLRANKSYDFSSVSFSNSSPYFYAGTSTLKIDDNIPFDVAFDISATTQFYNLVVGNGTHVTFDHYRNNSLTITGGTINNGTIQEKTFYTESLPTTLSFNVVDTKMTISNIGVYAIERIDTSYPGAPAPQQTGKYWKHLSWSSLPNLSLPIGNIAPANAKLCFLTNASTWDCAADSVANGYVTRNSFPTGIGQNIFVVGDISIPTATPSRTPSVSPTATRTATITQTVTPTPLSQCDAIYFGSFNFNNNRGLEITFSNGNSFPVFLTGATLRWVTPLPPNAAMKVDQAQLSGLAWYINPLGTDVNGIALNASRPGWQNGTPPDYANRRIVPYSEAPETKMVISFTNITVNNLQSFMSYSDFSGLVFNFDANGTPCTEYYNMTTSTPRPGATATPTPTRTYTPTPPPGAGGYEVGVYQAGWWYLWNGSSNLTVLFGGDASDLPVAGDWNGDSVDSIGVYRNNIGYFYLSNSNVAPSVSYSVLLGNPGDTPLAGRWAADMTHDGLGVFRPSNGILYEKRELSSGFGDYFAIFGNPGDVGIAGDWNGDGVDSVGVYRPTSQHWFLTNNGTPVGITYSDIDFIWDVGSNKIVGGDWNGDGVTTPGYYSFAGLFTLHPVNAATGSNAVFTFGPSGSNSYPVAGRWGSLTKPPNPMSVIDGAQRNPADLGSNSD